MKIIRKPRRDDELGWLVRLTRDAVILVVVKISVSYFRAARGCVSKA